MLGLVEMKIYAIISVQSEWTSRFSLPIKTFLKV